MRTERLKTKKFWFLFSSSLVVMVGYQDCAPVAFNPPTSNTGAAVQTSPGATGLITPVTPRTTVTCNAGYSYDGTSCVPIIAGVCKTYVELKTQPGSDPTYLGAYNVPARDGSQTCYFIHMVNAVDLGTPLPSNDWQTFRTDVISRYHTTTGDASSLVSQITGPVGHANFNPRIIGSTRNADGSSNVGATGNAQFYLLGQRTITLSGNSAGNVPMNVDNFILVEMNSNTLGSVSLAEGSADALPWANPKAPAPVAGDTTSATYQNYNAVGPITLGGKVIPFVSFGNGGTVDLVPKDISAYFPQSDLVSVKTTGLDCGGTGDVSDVYILFQ